MELKTIEAKIKGLNEMRLKKIKAATIPKPTGLFTTVIESKDGKLVHSFEDRKETDAIKLKNYFYKVLVLKLKQKVKISVKPQFKAG